MPIGQGLFGGGVPYPVSPAAQPGLMQDAWRNFGLAGLMSLAQGDPVAGGLAQALAAGRQAYAGGAERAYTVGREQEQDKQYQEYRQAQIQAAEALAEQRRQDAERERREAAKEVESSQEQAERVAGVLSELEQTDPARARGIRQVIALSGGKIPASVLGELMPQEPEAQEPILRTVPGVGLVSVDPETMEPTTLVRQQYKPERGREKGEPGLSASRLSTRLGQLVDDISREYQGRYDRGEITDIPPYHRIRAEAEERLRQEVAAVGRAGGGPPPGGGGGGRQAGMDVNSLLDQVLSAAPGAKREALRAEAERRMQTEDPQTVLSELARALGVL